MGRAPELRCVDPAKYDIADSTKNDQTKYPCPELLVLSHRENDARSVAPFDAAPAHIRDRDWDGDDINWSLEPIYPADAVWLNQVFQTSSDGVVAMRGQRPLDYEKTVYWEFWAVAKDSHEGSGRTRVRVNVLDKDEPPRNWNTAFTFVKRTEDGVVIRGTSPDPIAWEDRDRPRVNDYDVRYCKPGSSPCHDWNDKHWTEVLYIGAPAPDDANTVDLHVTGLQRNTNYKLQVRGATPRATTTGRPA